MSKVFKKPRRVRTKKPERKDYLKGKIDWAYETDLIMHEFVQPYLQGKLPSSQLKARIFDCMRRSGIAGMHEERQKHEDFMQLFYQQRRDFEETMKVARENLARMRIQQQVIDKLLSDRKKLTEQVHKLEDNLLVALKTEQAYALRAEFAEQDTKLVQAYYFPSSREPRLVPRTMF